jgi:diguanylate cyclase (GGDEF)-like protein
MTLSLGRWLVVTALAGVSVQAVVTQLPVHLAETVVFGGGIAGASWCAWACLRRARSPQGQSARGWLAGAVGGMLLIVAFATIFIVMVLGLRSPLSAIPGLLAIAANVVQLGLVAKPSRQRAQGLRGFPGRPGMSRVTRLLDFAVVVSAIATLSWVLIVVPALPAWGLIAPVWFMIVVFPALAGAAWALVLCANIPLQRNGHTVHLLGCAFAVDALSVAVGVHNTITYQPVYSNGAGAAIIIFPMLRALATKFDVPQPQHNARSATSLFWMTLPYLPVSLSLVGLAGIYLRERTVNQPLLCVLLGAIVFAMARQFLSLAAIRGLVLDLDKQRDELDYLSNHDPLTGLANRTLFHNRATAALAGARPDAMAAVLLLDLDGFKPVNDRYGHAAGDAVLVTVGQRLTELVVHGGVVARLGGDEFAVLLSQVTDIRHAEAMAEQITHRIGAPIDVNGSDLHIGVSIGIAVATDGQLSLDAVLRDADDALYDAKRAGKNTFRRHQAAMAA